MSEVTPEGLRTELLASADRLRGLRETPADKRSDTWDREVRYGVAEVNSLDAELKAHSVPEIDPQRDSRGPGAAFDSPQQYRSAGQSFIESEEYTGKRGRSSGDYTVQGGVRNLLDSGLDPAAGPASGLFAPVGQPIPPQVRQRRLFVRDLLTVVPTTLNSVPYIREKNVVTNELGFAGVLEGAIKPEVVIEFDRDNAPIEKIAGWIPITSEIMEDAPTLRGYIDARLGYMVAIREEQQVLSGTGTAPQMKGIRNFSGVQTQAAVYPAVTAGTPADVPATIGLALGLVEGVDGDADAIVMTPADFWQGLTTRYLNQFDGTEDSHNVSLNANPRNLWGYPVVTTRAATTDEALVGSFRMGATLFDRQQTVIKTTDSHSDYFIYNKLVVLAEERVGLAVNRPDFFVKAGLANHA